MIFDGERVEGGQSARCQKRSQKGKSIRTSLFGCVIKNRGRPEFTGQEISKER